MSLLDPSKPRQQVEYVVLTREGVVEKLESKSYSEKFKKVVLDLFDMDYAHENKERVWIGLLLASDIISEEHGEHVPYEVCIVQDKAGAFKGFCANVNMNRGRAMPESECIELWAMLMQAYNEREQAKAMEG